MTIFADMKYELAIFDLDGTLVDTIDDLGAAVNHALSLRGLPLHGREEYRLMVGNGVRNLVHRAMPEELKGDTGLLDALLADFINWYSCHLDVRSRPYPGIPELLARLRAEGVKLAVASNKFQAGTDRIIARFFPGIDFCAVLGGRDGVPLKPDPSVVRTIMETASASRESTVMVGDSATDMLTAKAAGICGAAVTWGFRPAEAVAECTVKADDAAELLELLL